MCIISTDRPCTLVEPSPTTVPLLESTPMYHTASEIQPLYINSDSDFGPLVGGYDFPGTGLVDDPYIIEGYTIRDSTKTLIHIQDTTAHFVIRNCLLDGIDGSRIGIYFSNVENGRVENTNITNSWMGVYLSSSCNDNEISQNTIYVCKNAGLAIDSSHYNTISGNSISNGDRYGISVFNSRNNLILDNKISANTGHGIYIYSGLANVISNNIIEDNSQDGIALFGSNYTTVAENTITNNGWSTSGAIITLCVFRTISLFVDQLTFNIKFK